MKTKRDRTGFSLVELMIALGILGVGLAMIATAFPSAMLENNESFTDTMSTLVAENATAICRVRLSHAAINDTVGGQLQDISSGISLAERAYPIARGDLAGNPDDWVNVGGTEYPSSRYGWLVAACQPTNDVNDYQLVIVPYRKFKRTDRPGTEIAFSDVTVSSGTVAGADIGSPVILKSTGEFAFVIDSDGNLTHALSDGDALAVNYGSGDESPAIGCYVVRTAVAP